MFDSGHKSQLMDGRREKFVRYDVTLILVSQAHKFFFKELVLGCIFFGK